VNSAALAAVVVAIAIGMMRVDGAELFPLAGEAGADARQAAVAESSAADQKLCGEPSFSHKGRGAHRRR
jgi:hypothetical protein